MSPHWLRRVAAVLWIGLSLPASSQVRISEILLNPPGTDTPHEYIEFRGVPNLILSNGIYFVAVNGETVNNPGTIQNVFDLSGRAMGGNGLLALLQKSHAYTVNSNAAILVNTNGAGWGSGSSSSIGHRGAGGQTDLQNPSITYLLIQTTNPPVPGDDIDAGNTGVAHGEIWDGWTVLDAVGILKNNAGDIAYGLINYRRDSAPGNAAIAPPGTIVPVSFTPSYVGRSGNTTGWTSNEWVAGDSLTGIAPNWSLATAATTVPAGFAGQALNHIGSPNFGAGATNGVVAVHPAPGLAVAEAGSTNAYKLGLNTVPGGNVTVQISAPAQLQVSTDGGATWAATRSMNFNSTALSTILVRAPADYVVDASPHWASIRHTITGTADPARYPTTALTPVVKVAIKEKDTLLLSELKANPPGTNDAPWEFIEIKGPADALLTNIWFVALEAESGGGQNPGQVMAAISLSSARLGSGGLLVVGAPGNPYGVPAGSGYFADARFGQAGGFLPNGPKTFLLVSSLEAFVEGADLDGGDNGVAEDLPEGATLLDSIAFSDGNNSDVFYSPAVLELDSATPDAALRFPGNATPQSAAAWGFGDLAGLTGESLDFDDAHISASLPPGTLLTPGSANGAAPLITFLPPLAGAVGDPTNPEAVFTVSDAQTPVSSLVINVTSTNQAVVPDSNLNLTVGPAGNCSLEINPVSAGYSLIQIRVSNGSMTGRLSFAYAASLMGRPGGRFHALVSDGSAAFAVDSNLMFIADDENQNLRIYPRSTSGPSIRAIDFTSYLNLTELYNNGTPKEMDIEGSTRVGNRIYWIGSGSNAEDGSAHPNRNRVFASDFTYAGTNSTLSFVGRYEHLKEDILAWDANNLHGKGSNYYGLVASAAVGLNPKEPDGSGFNIEGLTMVPGSTTAAYIGLRAPLVPTTNRCKALVLVVTNFTTLAVSGAAAGATRFGPPIELNLIHRGIRSFEGNGTNVLIVAGPVDRPSSAPTDDFRLFTWSGQPTNRPQERAANLDGTIPEGIVEVPAGAWGTNSQVQLISDNGTAQYYGDGIEAKRLPVLEFKKFRSDWVALGATVVSKPVIRFFEHTNGTVTLSWYSGEGLTNRVQWSSNLAAGSWNNVPGDITNTAATSWKNFPAPALPQVFYRVIVP